MPIKNRLNNPDAYSSGVYILTPDGYWVDLDIYMYSTIDLVAEEDGLEDGEVATSARDIAIFDATEWNDWQGLLSLIKQYGVDNLYANSETPDTISLRGCRIIFDYPEIVENRQDFVFSDQQNIFDMDEYGIGQLIHHVEYMKA